MVHVCAKVQSQETKAATEQGVQGRGVYTVLLNQDHYPLQVRLPLLPLLVAPDSWELKRSSLDLVSYSSTSQSN